jgi:hypothetical protein
MPSVIKLPARKNAVTYTPEQVEEVADLFNGDDAPRKGEGVAVDDAQDSEGKARNRAKAMGEALYADHDIDTRAHAVPDDNGGFVPVLSLKS